MTYINLPLISNQDLIFFVLKVKVCFLVLF